MMAEKLHVLPRPLPAAERKITAKKPDGDFIRETDSEPEGIWEVSVAGTRPSGSPERKLVWAFGQWGCLSLPEHHAGCGAGRRSRKGHPCAASGGTIAMPQPSALCSLGG